MNLPDFQKIKELFNKEKLASNKKLVAYLFFVGLATIFWFLNALSKEYTTTITYPVHYINYPSDKIVTSELPKKFKLRVKAFGFDLLRYKLSSAFLSNPFDVNRYTNNRLSGSAVTSYTLPTFQIKVRFERELSSGINLLEIEPDTLRFEFSPLIEKRVPIRLNVSYRFEQQYMLSDSVFMAIDSIWIKGPASIIDSINAIETKKLEFDRLDETTRKTIEFQQIEGVEYAVSKVLVTVPVEQFTEAQKIVAVTIDHLPDSLVMRLFPGEVKVSYFVGMKKYEMVSAKSFDLRVDYRKAIKENGNKVKVELNASPAFVSNVRMHPQSVSFLIENRKSAH